MEYFTVLNKDFVGNESTVIDIKINRLNALLFENKTGQSAVFQWIVDVVKDNRKETDYFKEVKNDLGIKVTHYKGFITVTNGGSDQYLEGKLKI